MEALINVLGIVGGMLLVGMMPRIKAWFDASKTPDSLKKAAQVEIIAGILVMIYCWAIASLEASSPHPEAAISMRYFVRGLIGVCGLVVAWAVLQGSRWSRFMYALVLMTRTCLVNPVVHLPFALFSFGYIFLHRDSRRYFKEKKVEGHM